MIKLVYYSPIGDLRKILINDTCIAIGLAGEDENADHVIIAKRIIIGDVETLSLILIFKVPQYRSTLFNPVLILNIELKNGNIVRSSAEFNEVPGILAMDDIGSGLSELVLLKTLLAIEDFNLIPVDEFTPEHEMTAEIKDILNNWKVGGK